MIGVSSSTRKLLLLAAGGLLLAFQIRAGDARISSLVVVSDHNRAATPPSDIYFARVRLKH